MTSAASAPWGIINPERVAVISAADETAKSGVHVTRIVVRQGYAGANRVNQKTIANFSDR